MKIIIIILLHINKLINTIKYKNFNILLIIKFNFININVINFFLTVSTNLKDYNLLCLLTME